MNTEKICRCCLALDVTLLSIYDGGSAGMGCVADMLMQIATLKPKLGDNMPEKACLQCISEINRCYVFKMKCENSNRTLRQLLPDAVPEPLDYIPKNVAVTSSAMQTEDKIVMSTIKEEKPSVSHSSVQTMDLEKPLVSHKEIQTENEFNVTEIEKMGDDGTVSENIIIYEEIQSPKEKRRKRRRISPLNKPISKKLYMEANETDNLLTIEVSETNTHNPNSYILLEDTTTDSICSEDAKLYRNNQLEKPKDIECNTFEYYDDIEIEEAEDDETSISYKNNEFNYQENSKTDDDNAIDNSETETKSTKRTDKSDKFKIPTKALSKPKAQYKCSHCILTFFSIKVLKRHLSNKHDIKDAELVIDCVPATEEPSSSDNTAKLQHLTEELTAENVAKPQLLPRGKVTPTVNEEDLTNIKHFCDYCQAGFAQRKTLTYHLKHQVCLTNNFKCNKCDGIFVSEENLKTHKLTHENPHKCLECDTVFKTIEELSQHMIENHNRSARNLCHVCKKVFTMKTSLMDHMRIHSGEKPFLCTICGKSFRQNSNLRQHLIRHKNEKNFKCDMCPNAYVTKAELFSHKRTHTGDQPYKCDICQARFTTACSLKKHARKHTGERPYACDFCPMRFAALNVLKNHRRIHTGEKPFKCNYCSKCFTQKGDCLMHERSHINKDFKCICKSKFTKKSNFKYHVFCKHPEMTEQELQQLIEKSTTDEAEYDICLMEDSPNSGDLENDGVEINETTDNNEELLEIVMEHVM